MKLMIIRHADPDYSIDSLTEKGWTEARMLAERMAKIPMDYVYVSPLGRAKDTASLTLEKTKKEAQVLPWLREFDAPIIDPLTLKRKITWDWLPAEWTKEEAYFDKDRWYLTPTMKEGHVYEEAKKVYDGLDSLLKEHGYERKGSLYRVKEPSTKTIVFFCHFGLECLLLGHLLNISPMVLWHGFCAPPSSVTTLYTEERRKGVAYFRMSGFGDVSHLYANDQEPAFAARFCETYDNQEQRHD